VRRRKPTRNDVDWLEEASKLSTPEASRPIKPTVGDPVDPARVEPLEVRAHLMGRVSMPHGPLAIDALLAATVCGRAALPPAFSVEEMHPVEIPVAREPAGRFHLASFSVGRFERFGPRWINRRFPIAEAQALAGPKLRRINIAGGPCKSYRIPLEAGHTEHDVLRWFLLGDRERVTDLLGDVHHLGKRRGVGLGRVLRWEVEPVEPWSGFPVVSPEGRALRTLPLNWPGLTEIEPGYRTLTYPYWNRPAETMCAMATRSW